MTDTSPRLVCFGNLTVDDVVLPDGTEQLRCIGGDALYAALGARLWEPLVEMVVPVGADFPQVIMQQIVDAGLSPIGLPQRSAPTIHNRITYSLKGDRVWEMLTPEEDVYTLSPLPDDIPASYLLAESFLVTAIDLEAQVQLVRWLRRHTKALIALDLQEDYIPGNEASILELCSQVDIFMPSEEEVRRLLGHEDWLGAAKHFASLGARTVVIKQAAAGVLIYDAETNQSFQAPAAAAKIVDTTGAGDAYCGGFVAALLRDPKDLKQAAQAGALSASVAIASFGATALFNAQTQPFYSMLP